MAVINRLAVLIAEKSIEEKNRTSIAQISRETGIAARTLQAWYSNQITRYDAPVIEALCIYFKCSPGDLLVCIPDLPTK